MTENNTPEAALRIRITGLPKLGELDEFDLRRFEIGEVYEVPVQLASLLILSGYAQLVPGRSARAEAADYGHLPSPKRPKR